MMFHSGLRGGMTMMMALMVDPYWSENQNTLVVATVTCVTGMAYICGCTGPYFLRTMGVPTGVDQEDGSLFDESSAPATFLGAVDTWVAYVIGLGAKQKESIGAQESIDAPAAPSISAQIELVKLNIPTGDDLQLPPSYQSTENNAQRRSHGASGNGGTS